MNYEALMEERQSLRSFEQKEVPAAALQEVERYFGETARILPEIGLELHCVAGIGTGLEGIAGYGGNAFRAPLYLVVLSEEKEGWLENAGFVSEQLLLKLTELGLSACWLTLTDEAATKRALGIESDKKAAALLAVGYARAERAEKRLDIDTPANVKVDTRAGHIAPKISEQALFFEEKFGQEASFVEDQFDPVLDKALYAASLAPSFHNRQAYRYLQAGRDLYLLDGADEKTTAEDRQLSLGATMANFWLVYSNYNPAAARWEIGGEASAEMQLPAEYRVAAKLRLY